MEEKKILDSRLEKYLASLRVANMCTSIFPEPIKRQCTEAADIRRGFGCHVCGPDERTYVDCSCSTIMAKPTLTANCCLLAMPAWAWTAWLERGRKREQIIPTDKFFPCGSDCQNMLVASFFFCVSSAVALAPLNVKGTVSQVCVTINLQSILHSLIDRQMQILRMEYKILLHSVQSGNCFYNCKCNYILVAQKQILLHVMRGKRSHIWTFAPVSICRYVFDQEKMLFLLLFLFLLWWVRLIHQISNNSYGRGCTYTCTCTHVRTLYVLETFSSLLSWPLVSSLAASSSSSLLLESFHDWLGLILLLLATTPSAIVCTQYPQTHTEREKI